MCRKVLFISGRRCWAAFTAKYASKMSTSPAPGGLTGVSTVEATDLQNWPNKNTLNIMTVCRAANGRTGTSRGDLLRTVYRGNS